MNCFVPASLSQISVVEEAPDTTAFIMLMSIILEIFYEGYKIVLARGYVCGSTSYRNLDVSVAVEIIIMVG